MHNFRALWCATAAEQKHPCTSLMWNEAVWLAYSPMTNSRRYSYCNIVQITKSLICHQRILAVQHTLWCVCVYKPVWFTAVWVSVKPDVKFGWGHHTSGEWHSFETLCSELKLLSPTEQEALHFFLSPHTHMFSKIPKWGHTIISLCL